MEHHSAVLLRRLNPYCARALEGAASLCQTRAHAEILPELAAETAEQGEGDLTVLARRYEWDMDGIWRDLLGWLDTLPRSVRSRPQLADHIQTLMQEAWMIASLSGEAHIRSVHLLMALVEKTGSGPLRWAVAAVNAGPEPAGAPASAARCAVGRASGSTAAG